MLDEWVWYKIEHALYFSWNPRAMIFYPYEVLYHKKKLEVPFTQALYQVWLMLARWYESLMCANNIETDWLGQTDQPKRLTDKTKVKIALFGTTHQCSDLWVFYISDGEGNHAINHSFPKKYKAKNICLKTNFSKKKIFSIFAWVQSKRYKKYQEVFKSLLTN